MRKALLTTLAATTIAATALAEGYQVNTLSTRQIALGHTGVSQKLGAESMYFNPAGLGFMTETADFSAGVTGIFPTAYCTHDGTQYSTDNTPSTPFFVYAGFKVSNPVKVGISLYTPYGSGINWTNNWAGAIGSQKVVLKTFCIQPTIAWQLLPNLSVGAGATFAWGSVDLSKGLISGESFATVLAQLNPSASWSNDITPASVNLKGKSKLAFGFNVGAMWDINEKFTVGASFRSKMMAKVNSGDAVVSYANSVAQGVLESKVGLIDQANFKAAMPMPYTFTVGLSYRPIKKLELSADAQLTGWSTYKNLNIEFLESSLSGFNQYLTKNYSNSWAYRIGAAYNLNEQFDLLAGVNYDMTPVNSSYYNPETPGMDKISPSLGVAFRPFNGFTVTMACSYIHGTGIDNASYQYDDLLYKSLGYPEAVYQKRFSADYKCHAWAPSISIGYKF